MDLCHQQGGEPYKILLLQVVCHLYIVKIEEVCSDILSDT